MIFSDRMLMKMQIGKGSLIEEDAKVAHKEEDSDYRGEYTTHIRNNIDKGQVSSIVESSYC